MREFIDWGYGPSIFVVWMFVTFIVLPCLTSAGGVQTYKQAGKDALKLEAILLAFVTILFVVVNSVVQLFK